MRVLIVDDNATNRRILRELLTRYEMRTCDVAGGEQALAELLVASASADPYQLILTDMHMPNMDGFGLVEKIREHARTVHGSHHDADVGRLSGRCRALPTA